MADPENDYRHGDNDNNLLRKILNRIGAFISGGGGGGGNVTLNVSDVEIGAVELKDGTTDTRAKVRTSDPDPGDEGLVVRNIPSGTQAVSGPLTNAELRAAAVPISGTIAATQSGVWTVAATQSGAWSVSVLNFPAVQPVNDNGGSLTVDGSISVSNFPAVQSVNDNGGSLTVDGTIAATQSGAWSVSVSNFPASQAVTGPLTDAELRASAVPVSGPLTDVQLALRVNTLGQKTMANSTPVVLASDQASIPITGSFLLDSRALTDRTAFTQGISRVLPAGFILDETADVPPSENDSLVARVDSKRSQVMVIEDTTTRGRRVSITAANAMKVDGSAVTQPVSGSVTVSGSLTTTESQVKTDGSVFTFGADKVFPISFTVDEAGVDGVLGESGHGNARIDIKRAQIVAIEDSTTRGQRLAISAAGAATVTDNQTIADNAGFTDGISKVFTAGFIFDETAGTALTENDAAAARIDSKRAQVLVLEDATTRGQRQSVGVPGNASVYNDWSFNAIPKRYTITVILTPANATALTNLMGLRKLNANAAVRILRLRITIFHAAAGVAITCGWKRATTVAGGTQVTAADIPKHNTAAADATLEVRTGAVTVGAEANQYIFTTPASVTAAPGAGVGAGIDWEWRANDRAGAIRLTGDEGLILEQIVASDTDNRIHVTVEWEEE